MTCEFCGGKGYIEYTDIVDYGSAKVSMKQTFECEDCLGSNICPQCDGDLDDNLYCEECDKYWDEDF